MQREEKVFIDATWVLPEKYGELSSKEKSKALRACITKFLQSNGPATRNIIMAEIQASNHNSMSRALDYLASTRQIYSESYGARDTIYFPNGRLAHPLLQSDIKCGRTEYTVRTYVDKLTGRNLTITEYGVAISGERKAKGGIRIDLTDLEVLIAELERIQKLISEDSKIVDRGLLVR